MRIDPNVVASPSLETQKTQQSAKVTAPVAPVAASAVVSLSPAATSASSTTATAKTAGAQPTVTARLEKIRALLDAGEYPVDLDLLASRIVDDDSLRSRRS